MCQRWRLRRGGRSRHEQERHERHTRNLTGICSRVRGSELGVDIISMRGYDLLDDAIDIGEQVIPIVREGVAKRDAAQAADVSA